MRTGKKPLRNNDKNTLHQYAHQILTDQVQSITVNEEKKKTPSRKAIARQALRDKELLEKNILP